MQTAAHFASYTNTAAFNSNNSNLTYVMLQPTVGCYYTHNNNSSNLYTFVSNAQLGAIVTKTIVVLVGLFINNKMHYKRVKVAILDSGEAIVSAKALQQVYSAHNIQHIIQ